MKKRATKRDAGKILAIGPDDGKPASLGDKMPESKLPEIKPPAKPVLTAGRVSIHDGAIRLGISLPGIDGETPVVITHGKLAALLEAVPWHRILDRDAADSFDETRGALLEMQAHDDRPATP